MTGKIVRRWLCRVLFLLLTAGGAAAMAQTDATQTGVKLEATDSMGVGLESRFLSGAKPIEAERVNIVPGTPLTVRPTMDNLVTGKGTRSFGGILGRYDTNNFGKIFAAGTAVPMGSATPKVPNASARDASAVTPAAVQRVYPPRLVVDSSEYPVEDGRSETVRRNAVSQVQNLATRLGFDPTREKVELVFIGRKLILKGQLLSEDHSQVLERVLSMESGIDHVENQLVISNSSELGVMPLP